MRGFPAPAARPLFVIIALVAFIGTGVVSASHGGSGSYQAGAVSLSQAFGSCEHPTGGVSISVGGGTGHFGGGRIR